MQNFIRYVDNLGASNFIFLNRKSKLKTLQGGISCIFLFMVFLGLSIISITNLMEDGYIISTYHRVEDNIEASISLGFGVLNPNGEIFTNATFLKAEKQVLSFKGVIFEKGGNCEDCEQIHPGLEFSNLSVSLKGDMLAYTELRITNGPVEGFANLTVPRYIKDAEILESLYLPLGRKINLYFRKVILMSDNSAFYYSSQEEVRYEYLAHEVLDANDSRINILLSPYTLVYSKTYISKVQDKLAGVYIIYKVLKFLLRFLNKHQGNSVFSYIINNDLNKVETNNKSEFIYKKDLLNLKDNNNSNIPLANEPIQTIIRISRDPNKKQTNKTIINKTSAKTFLPEEINQIPSFCEFFKMNIFRCFKYKLSHSYYYALKSQIKKTFSIDDINKRINSLELKFKEQVAWLDKKHLDQSFIMNESNSIK
jgi:hypothetical protein